MWLPDLSINLPRVLILLQVMSQLYYFGEQMNTEVSAAIPEEVEALSR